MGARKRLSAEFKKKERKMITLTKLNNCSSSPRKMRLIADMIRGKNIDKALLILKYTKKQAAIKIEKLVLSAISNWKNNNLSNIQDENIRLFIKEIKVDGGISLKRLRTAPQGRGNRIRKRSNHVTVIIDKIKK